MNETRSRTRLGAYWHDGAARSDRIEISSIGDGQELTIAHEMGHFLDHQVIGERGRWGTSRTRRSADAAAVMTSIENSQAIQSMRELERGPLFIDGTTPDGSPARYAVNRAYLRYLLEDREQFARAYAQYIAVRSKDARMLQQVEAINREGVYRRQWSDDDFEPIGRAFDALFTTKGWLR